MTLSPSNRPFAMPVDIGEYLSKTYTIIWKIAIAFSISNLLSWYQCYILFCVALPVQRQNPATEDVVDDFRLQCGRNLCLIHKKNTFIHEANSQLLNFVL